MADVIPLKLDPSTGMVKQFTSGDTISTTIAPGSGGGGSPVVIRPAQITSNQDDYSPTDWATATFVVLSTDEAFLQITGFSATGISDGEQKTLYNEGSFTIVLPIQHTSSSAANRLILNKTFLLFPGQSVMLIYDASADRWAIIGEYSHSHLKGLHIHATGYSTTTGDFGAWNFQSLSGAISSLDAVSGFPGAWAFTTSASATAGYVLYMPKGRPAFLLSAGLYASFSGFIKIPTLSTSGERFTVGVRCTNTTINNFNTSSSQFGLRYSDDINSGKWQLYVIDDSGTAYTADTGITADTNGVLLRVDITNGGTEFHAFINNKHVAILVPGAIPAAALLLTAGLLKSVGTTTRSVYVASASLTVAHD